jgi:hypothetical protein
MPGTAALYLDAGGLKSVQRPNANYKGVQPFQTMRRVNPAAQNLSGDFA